MRLVVFGLTISSSWGNGHATLWRGLCRALAERGHVITFLERDTPYYAEHRDRPDPEGVTLVLYDTWDAVRDRAAEAVRSADVALVTSYCPNARDAFRLIESTPGTPLRVFYDLDSPVTLEKIREGAPVAYLPPDGLTGFDLVLSYAGGPVLEELATRFRARRVAPLHGSVDPGVHRPAAPDPLLWGDLSYLGTYAADRQEALQRLFLEPARFHPERAFVLGGSQYPDGFPWPENVRYVRHVPPPRHAAFYSSSRFTLNITRGPMLATGHCPSGRLFEAAACGAAIVTDRWKGLEEFFEPDREILVADGPEDVARILRMDPLASATVGEAARRRALADHTSSRRARELETLLETAGLGRVPNEGDR